MSLEELVQRAKLLIQWDPIAGPESDDLHDDAKGFQPSLIDIDRPGEFQPRRSHLEAALETPAINETDDGGFLHDHALNIGGIEGRPFSLMANGIEKAAHAIGIQQETEEALAIIGGQTADLELAKR